MKEYKVCHVTTVHRSKDVRIFYKECRSLASAGFDVSLIVINQKSEIVDKVRIINVNVNLNSRIQRFKKASKAVFEVALKEDADIYHFHDPEFLPFAAKLKKLGKKVLYDAHEDLPRLLQTKVWVPWVFRKPLSYIMEKYEDRIASKMDHVITATPHIRDRFLKVNPNVTDIKNYPILEELPSPVPWTDKKQEICYIGAITKARGIIEIVKSMSLVNAQLNLGGKISTEKFGAVLSELAGWEKVNQLGYIGRGKVHQVLNTSKVGIVTLQKNMSYLHALPVKMFEYMAAGLPVVVSDFPILRSIVDKNKCGICVDPSNHEKIAEAVNYLLENSNEAQEMGRRGRKAVVEQFYWRKEETVLLKIYNDLLNG